MRLHMYDMGPNEPCDECDYLLIWKKIQPDCSNCPFRGYKEQNDES